MNLYTGKDLNEALDKAADAENVDIEYLQYRITRETENEVEIEAYFVADVIDYVKGYLNTVLTNMNLSVELSAKYEGEVINVNIKTDHDAVLIGRGGRTLQALNELVRVAIHNRYNKHYKILLDIGEYKEEKYEKTNPDKSEEHREINSECGERYSAEHTAENDDARGARLLHYLCLIFKIEARHRNIYDKPEESHYGIRECRCQE